MEVKSLMTPVVVSYWAARAKIEAIPGETSQQLVEYFIFQTIPIPESKSGTMAARVIMIR